MVVLPNNSERNSPYRDKCKGLLFRIKTTVIPLKYMQEKN